jgi:soluble lytic murein transglycosylase
MTITKTQLFCVLALTLLLILLSSSFFWQHMFPVAYLDEVSESAALYDVNPYLILAMIRVESNFKHNSLSAKGAVGLMQLMPDTAAWANVESRLRLDSRAYIDEPKANILLGTWYLAWLLNRYDQDMIQAVVAYNAGQGNVDRWINAGIWDGSEYRLDQVPIGETRHYAARVLYYFGRYQEIYEGYF